MEIQIRQYHIKQSMGLELRRVLCFLSLLLFAYSQNLPSNSALLPTSNCPGGCIQCNSNSLATCLPQIISTTGIRSDCQPHYKNLNLNCNTPYEVYSLAVREAGIATGWSPQPATSACTDKNGASYTVLGPLAQSSTLQRTVTFPSTQLIQKVTFKITLAVTDNRLDNSVGPTVQQTVDAANMTVAIVTPSLSSPVTTTYFNAQIILNSGSSFTVPLAIQYKSTNKLSCGYVYSFLIEAPSAATITTAAISISSQGAASWSLISWDVLAGCSAFASTLSTAVCGSCLGGTYPEMGMSSTGPVVSKCGVCDYRCQTCASATTCLTCEANAQINPSSKMCEYLTGDFLIYNITNLNLMTGTFQTAPEQVDLMGVIQSANSQVILTFNPPTIEGYLVKFIVLTPSSMDNIPVTITINDVADPSSFTASVSNLQSYIPIGSQTRSYMTQVRSNQFDKSTPSRITISVSAPSGNNFKVSNVMLVQHTCLPNCLKCSFSAIAVTSCISCQAFFDASTGCQNCATGFTKLANSLPNSNRCVKCHVTCLTCSSPNNLGCLTCFTNFMLSDYTTPLNCISCVQLNTIANATKCASVCPSSVTITTLNANSLCQLCFGNKESSSSDNCLNCFIGLGITTGRCVPQLTSNYNFYLSDSEGGLASTAWTGSSTPSSFSCTSDYPNMIGISKSSSINAIPTTLTYRASSLPAHTGITVMVVAFKVDGFAKMQNASATTATITLLVGSSAYPARSSTITVPLTAGSNICGGPANEFMVTFNAVYPDHTGTTGLTVQIVSADDGIFARQLEIYLSNCEDCASQDLSFSLKYIPNYSASNNQTGLNVWLFFSGPINISNGTLDNILNTVQFQLNDSNYPGYLPYTRVASTMTQTNSAMYFLPLNQSFINDTLSCNLTQGQTISAANGIVSNQPLSSFMSYISVDRYQNVGLDDRINLSETLTFFEVVSWITVITMIIFALFGCGSIFEDFSIIVQLIGLQIFINTPMLPASLKVPLSGLLRVVQLNPFADSARSGIESSFFSNSYPSPYYYQQFGMGVHFTRIIYAVIIFNIIYLSWFILSYLLVNFIPFLKNSEIKVARFIRNIPTRPINYIDQIARYQFLTIMWASVIQFTYFVSFTGSDSLNLAVCVISFIVAVVWPFFVAGYTYFNHSRLNIRHFQYLYEDVYYRRITSVAEQSKYYIYGVSRAVRLILYAVFIAISAQRQIVGSFLIIFLNLLDGFFIAYLGIFRDTVLLGFKIVEDVGLIALAIITIILVAESNVSDFDHQSYFSVGNVFIMVAIILIINAFVRVCYLGYKKYQDFSSGRYDVGEHLVADAEQDNVNQILDQEEKDN